MLRRLLFLLLLPALSACAPDRIPARQMEAPKAVYATLPPDEATHRGLGLGQVTVAHYDGQGKDLEISPLAIADALRLSLDKGGFLTENHHPRYLLEATLSDATLARHMHIVFGGFFDTACSATIEYALKESESGKTAMRQTVTMPYTVNDRDVPGGHYHEACIPRAIGENIAQAMQLLARL